ncbi:hypothetical protein Naga_101963g1, partial [Nannochloropsis gaditana]
RVRACLLSFRFPPLSAFKDSPCPSPDVFASTSSLPPRPAPPFPPSSPPLSSHPCLATFPIPPPPPAAFPFLRAHHSIPWAHPPSVYFSPPAPFPSSFLYGRARQSHRLSLLSGCAARAQGVKREKEAGTQILPFEGV